MARKRKRWLHLSNKEEVLATLEIRGRVPSKKNSVDFAYRKGRPIYLGNSSYNKKKKGFIRQLKEQLEEQHPTAITCPVDIHVLVYGNREGWFKEWERNGYAKKYTGQDVDNKLASIMDLLKDAGAFHDDSQIIRATTQKEFGKAHFDDYGALIVITKHAKRGWPGGKFFRGWNG